jgi:hypothetical protein
MNYTLYFFTLLLFPSVLLAHHSRSAHYDTDKITVITGEITEVRWRNPHVQVELKIAGSDNQVDQWTLQGPTVNQLRRFGVSEEDYRIGDHIKVSGNAGRRGKKSIWTTEISLISSGQVLWSLFDKSRTVFTNDSIEKARKEADGIFRVWTFGKFPNTDVGLTSEAEEIRSSWDAQANDSSLQCIAQGMPGIMQNPFPIEFINNNDTINIRIEEYDTVRTIHMRDNSTEMKPNKYGYSIGSWSGSTLIVNTTMVTWGLLDDSGIPLSEKATIVEHFTLTDDENRLDYDVTVTDPNFYDKPARITDGYWHWVPGESVAQFNCVTDG